MNKVFKLFMGAVLALGIVALSYGPAYAGCSYYNYNYITGTYYCAASTPDLLPNARLCTTGSSPGANEVIFYAQTTWNESPYCQIITVYSGTQYIASLSGYYWNGVTHHVVSFWAGSNVQMGFWSGSFTGSYKSYNTTTPYQQTWDGNIGNDWHWYPESCALHLAQ